MTPAQQHAAAEVINAAREAAPVFLRQDRALGSQSQQVYEASRDLAAALAAFDAVPKAAAFFVQQFTHADGKQKWEVQTYMTGNSRGVFETHDQAMERVRDLLGRMAQ